MATILLSGLGGAIGGQFGAFAGALVGRTIDATIGGGRSLRVKEDLTVQTADYGRLIPRIYGRMRVGGAIVWSTDLVAFEGSSTKSGSVGTSYFASFAVALSARSAINVGRIWADGKIIRGMAGDFKVPTKFRFHPGGEDQPVDPLIASIEGEDATTAFRGLALAVFEELHLAEFGNRIPQLTFELVADTETVTASDISSDLLGEPAGDGSDRLILEGFAAFGETVAEAIAPLADAAIGTESGVLIGRGGQTKTIAVSANELGCGSRWRSGTSGPAERRLTPQSKLPIAVGLSYFDAALNYQAGEQRVSWGASSKREIHIELPAVLTAGAAKTVAQVVLQRHWVAREKTILRLPPSYLGLRPGDLVTTPDGAQRLIVACHVEDMAVILECQPKFESPMEVEGDSGRSLLIVDRVAPPSEILLLDLPAFDSAPISPSLFVAGRGGSDPWRPMSATLTASRGGLSQLVRIDQRATVGKTLTALLFAPPDLLDRSNQITVELADDDWLTSCTLENLQGGANLALAGDEIVQFATAKPLGDRVFILSSLLRGRFGTEWAATSHSIGERFIFLTNLSKSPIELSSSLIGSVIEAECSTVGDGEEGSQAAITFMAESLRPPSPAHLSAQFQRDGSLWVRWVRRSRLGYHWFDYVDVPVGETSEQYVVTLSGSASALSLTLTAAECTISPARLAELGFGDLAISVVQLGSMIPSRPTALSIRI